MGDAGATRELAVHCPLCQAVSATGFRVSEDIDARLQGTVVQCGKCGAKIHAPDLRRGTEPQIATLDHDEAFREFDRFLIASKARNALYYYLTLFGWHGVQRTIDFMAEVNRLTSEVVLSRGTPSAPARIGAHEMLFVLQANLEAKAYYATWRNFLSPLVGRRFAPEPWRSDLNEVRVRRDRAELSTGQIVKNLTEDLRVAGFEWLSLEFLHTHQGIGALVRNAVAHASFLAPSAKTGQAWLFGVYMAEGTGGGVRVEEHVISHEHLEEWFRRFLGFRLASMKAFQTHRDGLKDQRFDFEAENQMKPGEVLKCRFENGNLRVTSQGTPVW